MRNYHIPDKHHPCVLPEDRYVLWVDASKLTRALQSVFLRMTRLHLNLKFANRNSRFYLFFVIRPNFCITPDESFLAIIPQWYKSRNTRISLLLKRSTITLFDDLKHKFGDSYSAQNGPLHNIHEKTNLSILFVINKNCYSHRLYEYW